MKQPIDYGHLGYGDVPDTLRRIAFVLVVGAVAAVVLIWFSNPIA